MRILFIIDQIDYEPQGIMQLAGCLKRAGHEVRLAVAALEDPVAVAVQYRPHVVGYSVITGSQRYFLDLNRRVKKAVDAFSVFGGPHPTFFPEMVTEEGVDGICIGEGEQALLSLLERLQPDGKLKDTQVAGWYFNVDGQIVRNEVCPYADDLDSLPSPDYALVYEKDLISRRSKIKHFIAGRGCPYGCTYCFNHALKGIYAGKGKHVRMRSPERIVEDILWVCQRYPLEFVVFVDDTFVLNRRWLEEFAAEYRSKVGLPFFCNVRANLVNPEMVRLLRYAGCHSVSMGIEAGNDHVRNELLQRNMTKEQILNAAELLRVAGLHFTTTNMIGLPGTTLDDDIETLDLNIKVKPAYAHVFIFQPYPRTLLGEYVAHNGLIEGTIDDIGERAWDHSILKFSPEHKRALTNLQRLFAIAVEWPRLRDSVLKSLSLPGNYVFWLANKLWKGYAIKQRVHPVRMSPRDLVDTAWRFMKIKS